MEAQKIEELKKLVLYQFNKLKEFGKQGIYTKKEVKKKYQEEKEKFKKLALELLTYIKYSDLAKMLGVSKQNLHSIYKLTKKQTSAKQEKILERLLKIKEAMKTVYSLKLPKEDKKKIREQFWLELSKAHWLYKIPMDRIAKKLNVSRRGLYNGILKNWNDTWKKVKKEYESENRRPYQL
jgi:DNA-binding Lrp family transcriptional regulator